MNTSAVIDPQALRQALGSFATGVTIVTTRDAAGLDVGLTANSFNSVSLNPPMILWSLAKSSRSLLAFVEAREFAVHILAADQRALSNRFAQRGIDKFATLTVSRSGHGTPLLEGCSARFICRTAFRYEGGDHDIFVGEVTTFEHFDRPPLLFHGGRYADVRRETEAPNPDLIVAAQVVQQAARDVLDAAQQKTLQQLLERLLTAKEH